MSDERFTALTELANIDKDKLKQLYTLAQIDCLSKTKDKIVRWFGAWVVVFTLAITVLGAFGIDQLIAHRVSTRVSSEINKSQNEIEGLQVRIRKTQEEVNSEVTKAKYLMKELGEKINSFEPFEKKLTGFIKRAEDQLDKFREKKTIIEPLVKDLANLAKQGDLKLALHKLIADFYTIKEVEVHVTLKYSKDLEKLILKHGVRTFYMNNFALLRSKDIDDAIIQFSSDDESITMIGRRGLSYSLQWFAPYRDSLSGKLVEELKAGALKFYVGHEQEQMVDAVHEVLRFIEEAQVQVMVNGVRILSERVDKFQFSKRLDENGFFELSSIHDLGEKLKNPKSVFDSAVSSQLEQIGVR